MENGAVENDDLFRRGIWSMDEDEIVEMGKQMIDIHQASKYVSMCKSFVSPIHTGATRWCLTPPGG